LRSFGGEFLKNFSRDEKYIFYAQLFIYFLCGIYVVVIGIMVPNIRDEYGVSYELSGYLISAASIGVIVVNILASYTAQWLGFKTAFVLQHALVIVGFVIVTVTGHPAALLGGMALLGIGRGSTVNYSNQIVNDLTKSSSRAMNLIGIPFAIGACITPPVVLLFTNLSGSWKYSNYIISAAAAVGILLTLLMKIGREGVRTDSVKLGGFSFLKKKKFILALISLFFYFGMEIAIGGWIVTYFRESHTTSGEFATLVPTILWISLLAGRIVCSIVANRLTPAKLVRILSLGIAGFMILFLSNINFPLLVVSTIGLGIFMSGAYSTILADAGPIFSEYRNALGWFIMFGGLGTILFPAIIGRITERHGIQSGMNFLAVTAAAYLIVSFVNVYNDNRTGKNKSRIE